MSNYTSALTGAANPKITQETMDQIAMVTDPYHDKNLRLSGYPDGTTVTSTLRRQAGQTTINGQFVLGPGESWDFTVFTTPLHYQTEMLVRGTGVYANGLTGVLVDKVKVGPVNIMYRHWDNAGEIKARVLAPLGELIALSTNETRGPTRTVALAYELHNTTAELYKSGALTSYRNNVEGERVDLIQPGTPNIPISLTKILTLPSTLEDVQMLPNCRTWEAADGAYSVSLPPPDNPYCSSNFQNICIYNGFELQTHNIWAYCPLLAQRIPSWSKLSTTGTMSSRFTNNDQTFTLDFRQVLEIAPVVRSTLLAFATTSPAQNPVFLKLYKRMFNSIEAAVPVHYNSAGEWFRRIVKLAKEHLPAVIHLLPAQYRAPAMALLPIANKIADKIISKTGGNQNNTQNQSQTQATQRMTHSKKK